MRVLLPVVCMLLSVFACAQLVPVDSAALYAGKSVTIFGRVVDIKFSESKRHDTTYFKLAGNLPHQYVTLVLYPGSRVGFGYKPELVLLNKTIYVSGNIEMQNGLYQLEIKTPFDIAFSPARFLQRDEWTNGKERQGLFATGDNSSTRGRKQKGTGSDKSAELAMLQDMEMITKLDSLMQVQKQPVEKTIETINTTPADRVSKMPDTPLPCTDTVRESLTPAIWETRIDTTDSVSPQQNENLAAELQVPTPGSIASSQATLKSDATIKAGPGKYFAIFGQVKKGDIVTVLLRHVEWCKIAARQGAEGKVIQGFVKTDELK